MKTTFLFMPTMKCNLKCGHCHFKIEGHNEGYDWRGYGRNHRIHREIEWHRWIVFLEQFRPYHLELSGGEPLLYAGMKKVLSHLPPDATWAVTSNTLLDVTGIVNERCICWTASWHGVNMDKFLVNLDQLRKHGINPSVSIVVEFNAVQKCLDDALLFRKKGFRVNLLRELNPGINWTGTDKWEMVLAMKPLGFNVVEEDIPPSYEFKPGGKCKAGHEYFCLMPDGMVYRCYSHAMIGSALGTIDSMKKAESLDCGTPCLGCALDHRFKVKE